jgi:hypothetical protein
MLSEIIAFLIIIQGVSTSKFFPRPGKNLASKGVVTIKLHYFFPDFTALFREIPDFPAIVFPANNVKVFLPGKLWTG